DGRGGRGRSSPGAERRRSAPRPPPPPPPPDAPPRGGGARRGPGRPARRAGPAAAPPPPVRGGPPPPRPRRRAGGPPAAPGAGRPSAESPHERGGEAGTRADLVARPGGVPTTRARPEDAWLKLLYARVRDRVVFPRSLAVSFDQGAVVVAFTVKNADGAVENV